MDEQRPMVVLVQRIAAMALATALTERPPARRHRLSGAQSVAAGLALGTVGRIAVKRRTKILGRRASRPRAVDPEPAQPVEEPPSTDDAMTRSEEELHVRTVRRERGRIRVRKYVVTEEVQQTIALRREEIRIEEALAAGERADAAESDDGAEVYDSEPYEIVLHEEVPVIEKRVVPRERVRIIKDAHREEAEVVDEVRAERIDVERIDVRREPHA